MNKGDNLYVTGDIHGDVNDLTLRIDRLKDPSKQDILFLLGDCAFFYYSYYDPNNFEDQRLRKEAAKLPITLFCVQGNHEQPFDKIKADKKICFGAQCYYRDGIYFIANGEVLTINNKRILVIGGAESVDKKIRVARNYPYWESEELTDQEFSIIIDKYRGQHFDIILSHTAPYSLMPRDTFLPGISQMGIQNRTEMALEKLRQSITYDRWYCGHFHADRVTKEIRFVYHDILEIS